jgi:MoaA/NifB/PqqE/SkfB family radical SAM enzyme
MKYQILEIAEKVARGARGAIIGIKNLILISTSDILRPTQIVYMVTDRCNSRCVHCNIWRNEPSKDPLIPEEVEQLFKDDLFKNVKYVLCTGGEPAVRNDLQDIILGIHKALPNATIQLSTNGLLPDRVIEVAKTAVNNGICLDVGVSLDGIGKEHDKIRGVKGNFARSDRLIHELVALRDGCKNKLSITVGVVISDLTLDSLSEVRSYAKRLNIELTEAWYNESSFYDNVGKNVFRSKRLIEAVRSQPPSPLQNLWLRALHGKSIKFPCFAMQTFFVLKCNGDIVPCLTKWNSKAGNVRESSPMAIWHSDEAKKVRKIVKACQGCLNSWGAGWSLSSSFYSFLFFYLKNPRIAFAKLGKR